MIDEVESFAYVYSLFMKHSFFYWFVSPDLYLFLKYSGYEFSVAYTNWKSPLQICEMYFHS